MPEREILHLSVTKAVTVSPPAVLLLSSAPRARAAGFGIYALCRQEGDQISHQRSGARANVKYSYGIASTRVICTTEGEWKGEKGRIAGSGGPGAMPRPGHGAVL